MAWKCCTAWGMTEMSPLGTLCTLKNKASGAVQGRADEGPAKAGPRDLRRGHEESYGAAPSCTWDGKTYGDLLVKGPWIVDSYFKGEGGNPLIKEAQGRGWFPTGTWHHRRRWFMQITDRSKDVIKSGGEWISSIDIENIAMAHPAIAMAACVGMPHPKWDERTHRGRGQAPRTEVSAKSCWLSTRQDRQVADPDDVVFVDAIPLGAPGKMLKTKLREQLKDYKLPGCIQKGAALGGARRSHVCDAGRGNPESLCCTRYAALLITGDRP